MNILLIDTTSKNLIVAVVSNGQKYLACDYDCNRMHSVLLCDKISEVMILANLTLKDIDYISVNIGPGSFTGIRIGVATALGINAGVEAKLVEVNTLQMLAYTVHSECNCYVDAGNGYYYGRYNGLEEIVSPT
ncbi:MAG: tRNA (adenosine(37)-N6)-threonylcarbamoyltransferase complex dimerization subunit type 1 TsaB, partial [Clostridia bacterium]